MMMLMKVAPLRTKGSSSGKRVVLHLSSSSSSVTATAAASAAARRRGCWHNYYHTTSRLAAVSAPSSSTPPPSGNDATPNKLHQQPSPSVPPLIAKQVKTDRGIYKATLYYANDDDAADKEAAATANGGGSYKKVEPPPDKLSLQRVAEDGLRALLPRGYPGSVAKGYADYVKLQMVASLASSAIGVLSTQSLLYAMGLGAGAIPLAAALNWIIKDGIGQIGGIVFASVVNDRFDANPKRWKMVATISLDMSCGLELLAPLAPGYFLLIASMANVGKNVCFLSASASRAAIHNSFAHRENLADITAKAGSQFIVTSILGTGLGILLSSALGSSWTSLAPICATLSCIHITCNYLSLRHVCLNTVNAERLELIMGNYFTNKRVPQPFEISAKERFMWPAAYDTIAPSAMHAGIPVLRMGRPLEEVATPQQLPQLVEFFAQESYVINARGCAADRTATVDVLMKENATVDDALRAFVHAYYVRRAAAAEGWRAAPFPSMWARLTGEKEKREVETWLLDIVKSTHLELAQPSPTHPQATVMEDILKQFTQAGWLTESVFLPHTQDRVTFDLPMPPKAK